MELRYGYFVWLAPICLFVLAICFFIFRKKHKSYKEGIKVANTNLYMEEAFFQRKVLQFYMLRFILAVSIAASIIFACILLAQPYETKMTKENKYNRDIIICLDISSSVDELNKKLIKELKQTVRGLNGERIGIVIFNTSPVLLTPLTDDYEYTLEQLDNLSEGLKVCGDISFGFSDKNWSYWYSYLYSGTLVNNEERGSSLIGDGLLGAAFNFPDNPGDENRTKIIIFSTDNELSGEPLVSLPDAAKICKKRDITVYGIGTQGMTRDNMAEMKKSVELTGGKFYLEESSSTFSNITKEIESKSASLVLGKTILQKVPKPRVWFQVLAISAVLIVVSGLLLMHVNVRWIIRQSALVILLIFVFSSVVKPALDQGFEKLGEVKAVSNLRVLFVVDDTMSMIANDGDKDKAERLAIVRRDCETIVSELEGAEFSVISFHNHPTLLSPYNTNSAHIVNTVNGIYPLSDLYAKGSSLNTPHDLMLENLKEEYEKSGEKVAVFFFSDGEITDESKLQSYSDLTKYIDGGAVLGYGTKKGGTMSYKYKYADEPSELYDYSKYPADLAVSVIDEDNLKKLADDMNLRYVAMHDDSALKKELSSLKNRLKVNYIEEEKEETKSEDNSKVVEMALPENKGYWLLLPVLLILFLEGMSFVRKKA